MLKEILNKFKKGFNDIEEPPYAYDFLVSLDPKEYPRYLKKIYTGRVHTKLNLKHPKTFNEKIQWLKLYDTTPKKTMLTDKVAVRSYIREQIGEEYLKPVLWIGKEYDKIPFEDLPSSFIIKVNHGCKWHYVIKDKEEFLNNKALINIVKTHLNGWMETSFFPFAGFEMQYKGIDPQIIIEPLLRDDISKKNNEIEVYCFNGIAKIFQVVNYSDLHEVKVNIFDENFNHIDLKFMPSYKLLQNEADENLKLAVKLSEKLAKDFKLARVDWLIYQNKIYFNEITFTPFAGFYIFEDEKWNLKLGKMLDLRKD